MTRDFRSKQIRQIHQIIRVWATVSGRSIAVKVLMQVKPKSKRFVSTPERREKSYLMNYGLWLRIDRCDMRMELSRRFLGFYKGILPPILAETPKRAVKFFTFEQYKKLLSPLTLPDAWVFAIAGLGSGLTEAVVVNPFEVVKVSLQANRNVYAQQPSTFAQARHVIQTEGIGLRGLNKGLTATLGRHGVFNMVYFGFYFNVKNAFPVNKDARLEFLRKFTIGLASGTLASIINIPFDVAKSRIQGPQPEPGVIKYRSCWKTIITVYKEEGFLALYKGLLPKIMRLGPGNSCPNDPC
ncbi:mitochondrial 2-oxodicarboxylate carrier isoform X3 [Hyla sarda]|uniref:mitochondrial 2-oxodicarboxylate carrier isoform X3 n=1 Tax=Hyla sarda TaxID=327740 RepID=UPI0024C40C9D|nr:mitochondrial 2-oxodicarboxylate carrier isoform X3 [Hyla sarda]